MPILNTTGQLYENADELLKVAEDEQSRAQEDVVTHLICNNSRLSITHFLIGFLLQQNMPILPPASIASLQQQCQSIDPRFEVLDLDKMVCRYETPGKIYCLEHEKVGACLKAAQQVRALVMAESPAY